MRLRNEIEHLVAVAAQALAHSLQHFLFASTIAGDIIGGEQRKLGPHCLGFDVPSTIDVKGPSLCTFDSIHVRKYCHLDDVAT